MDRAFLLYCRGPTIHWVIRVGPFTCPPLSRSLTSNRGMPNINSVDCDARDSCACQNGFRDHGGGDVGREHRGALCGQRDGEGSRDSPSGKSLLEIDNISRPKTGCTKSQCNNPISMFISKNNPIFMRHFPHAAIANTDST